MAKSSTKHKSPAPGCVDYYNIRIMPHGGIILIPITLTTLAWVASISTDGCDYSRLIGPGVKILTGSAAVPYVDLGMNAYRIPEFYPASDSWRVAYTDECLPYQYSFEDRAWLAGKRFSFLAMWCGGASMMFLWVGTFLVLKPGHWKTAGVGVACAFVFQVFSFVWFNTSLCHTKSSSIEGFKSREDAETTTEMNASSCSLFYGSKCSIASTILYLIASLMILFGEYPAPEPKLIAEENYPMVNAGQSRSVVHSTSTRHGLNTTNNGKSTRNMNVEMA
ncbi:hypothetical protein HJC23_012589 [Cyclotella cryptica]|uniref:Uncharacterized protein n=1 Tax=Cyclotella cryptica TaxID=29204 RepID=A0ABD3NWZ3_9STRA|eukprot:CCRYP_019035-RA/>CCRYP_019035-RA protein AED:0.45 eAED:0.45 QI:0/-1/0/1/-1/1/1/0/277